MQANWFDREGAEVVERVQRYAQERLGSEQAELFLPFVSQYYGRIGADDLTETTVPDPRKIVGLWRPERHER